MWLAATQLDRADGEYLLTPQKVQLDNAGLEQRGTIATYVAGQPRITRNRAEGLPPLANTDRKGQRTRHPLPPDIFKASRM